MDWEAFFEVHKDLPREGPGTPGDVAWALDLAALPEGAVICDAGAGPGGDVAALLAVPGAQVVAFDATEAFVDQMRARFAGNAAVTVYTADMAEIAALPQAPFDMIWCAGALYFLGLKEGLRVMSTALKPGGVLAFSEPCYFAERPDTAAQTFWEGYPAQGVTDITATVAAAGFEVLGSRKVPDAGWEAYYQPLEARIAALRPGADARLTAMLDHCAAEVAQWRAVKDQAGYLLTVARRT